METVKNIQHNNIEYLLKLSIIGESAFKGCVELKTFTLPNTLTTIGAGAFEDCKKYNPTIPNSVSSLGDNCFKGTGIETLILSSTNNLEKIPNGAFENCKFLKKVILKELREMKIIGYNDGPRILQQIQYDEFKNICEKGETKIYE